MKDSFNSYLSEYISMYIQTKRCLGFKFEAQISSFKKLDRDLIERNEVGPGLSKDFCDYWYERNSWESERTYYARCILLREFSGFLNNMGVFSYCPRPPKYPKSSYVPYVFSHSEIERLFKAADGITCRYHKSGNGLYCISVLLRALYATGMRVGELLSLKEEDVDFSSQTITIRDSKNGTQRLIPMGDTLNTILFRYLKLKNLLLTGFNDSDYFFTNLQGEKLKVDNILIAFRFCLYKAGIHYLGPKIGPKVHSLRHTFACHSIARMTNDGYDPYVILPILATFLGHKQMDSINYYVRMTAEVFPAISKQLEDSCINVYPMIRNLDGYEAK